MFKIHLKPLVVLILEGFFHKERIIIFCFFEQLPQISAYQVEVMQIDIIATDIINRCLILKNDFSQGYFAVSVNCGVIFDPSVDEVKQLTDTLSYLYLILNAESNIGHFEAGLSKTSFKQVECSINIFMYHVLFE